MLEPELIPGALRVKQEFTPNGIPVSTHIQIWPQFLPQINLEKTHTDTGNSVSQVRIQPGTLQLYISNITHNSTMIIILKPHL